MSPLATRLQQGVKRRLYEVFYIIYRIALENASKIQEQDENEVNNGGEQNPNSIALLGALQEPPTKKPKHPVERIISQSKRRIFGGKKGPQQQSTNEEASVQVANPPNLPVTNFSNPNSPTAASSSGAGGGGVRRGIWNFLSFLMKPFSSPSPPQSQHH
jgi:hypothetical protein